MVETVIRRRGELDELWLPWCIDASTFERTTWEHDPPAGHPHAAQLRLTDLRLVVVERVLACQPVNSGAARSWPNIEYWRGVYDVQARLGETIVIDGTPGVDKPMVYEHRRCADARRGVSSHQRSVAVRRRAVRGGLFQATARWPGYENPAIRVRGRPFPAADTQPSDRGRPPRG